MTEPCTAWERIRRWVCQDPDDPKEGCEIGCAPCDDMPSNLIGYAVNDLSRRWLRPDKTRTHRDAHGFARILRSNTPIQVPPFVNYQLAPCWTNGEINPPAWGQEDFNGDACDCFPGPSFESEEQPDGTSKCPGGESVGDLINGWFPDCGYYEGYHWSRMGSSMSCRTVHNRDVDTIPIYSKRLFQAMFVRTGPCTANMLVPCAARVPGRNTCDPWWNPELPKPSHYNPDHQRFNYAGIDTESDPPRVMDDAMKTSVLNAVFGHVFADIRFDRLDYVHASGMDNYKLDWWERNYDGMNEPVGNLVVVSDVDLSGSYGLYDRQPVMTQLVIRRIHAGMSLVAHRVCHRDMYFDGSFVPCERQTYPHVRFRIQVECAVRVYRDGVYMLANSPGAGRIVYCNEQGRQVTPPDRVQWLGYLGHYSNPPIQNIAADHDYYHNIEGECHGFADTLEGVTIPAWPYRQDSRPDSPNQVYGGSIRLYWPNNLPKGEG